MQLRDSAVQTASESTRIIARSNYVRNRSRHVEVPLWNFSASRYGILRYRRTATSDQRRMQSLTLLDSAT